jgi:cytochrome c2
MANPGANLDFVSFAASAAVPVVPGNDPDDAVQDNACRVDHDMVRYRCHHPYRYRSLVPWSRLELGVALARRPLLMRRNSDQLWLWFGVSSIVFLVIMAVSPVKDYFREYREYQSEYRDLLLGQASSSRELREAEAQYVRVHQIWIPEFNNRVDRCTACHLGFDNPRTANAPEPFRLHPATPHTPDDVQSFGCVICHRGQGRATSLKDAHGDADDWDKPILPVEYTEASCGVCHHDQQVAEASLLSKGRALMTEYGCHGCHLIDSDLDWRSTAPDLNGLSQKTSPGWLTAWLDNPRELVLGSRMPDFQLSSGDIDSLVAYLWSFPSSSGHDIKHDEGLVPGDPDNGGKLFRESRCISCHLVDGRGNGSASELGGTGSKVKRGWLVAFLGDPHSFQPNTEMPRYNFSETELSDISQYMMDELYDPAGPEPGEPPRLSRVMLEAGERIFKRYGCGGCHSVGDQHDRIRIGPELIGIGDKAVRFLDFGERDDLPPTLPDWLAAKISNPRSFRAGLKMPGFNFESEDLQAVVTALLSYTSEQIPEAYQVATPKSDYEPPGRFGSLVERYRCLSCHQVAGTGGDISTAPLTVEGSRVREDWLSEYLKRPYTIRPILTDRMIPLWMSEDEAAFIADFISNVYVDNQITEEIFPDGLAANAVERGRQLFYERYGCQACHMMGQRGGYVGPLLDDVGSRLASGWVFWWLQGPTRWRSDIRCPDYGIDDKDARDLAAFLMDLGRPHPGAQDATTTGSEPR